MKIHQLLNGIPVAITNEERDFIKSHRDIIPLSSLDERSQWLAQNLVRKNVYKVTKDNNTIVINKDNESNRPAI